MEDLSNSFKLACRDTPCISLVALLVSAHQNKLFAEKMKFVIHVNLRSSTVMFRIER